ncbi:MAG: AgmX/PglI C-terminal domain-containing protein [Chitinispirillales bacterium]|jgi:TonB family protein|nr:AgmX/PglI C-terminal domain-containing protein [Chitinispirillales bacterium]
MNTLISHSTTAAARILFAALGVSVVLLNCDRQQHSATTLPQGQSTYPTLKINGKEDPSVYLQSLDIQVEVSGNIASTRQTMVFKNKTDRVLEGELTFPLPEGRTVTFYALDINGKMREAVPVEKVSGTQVFEEIEQRRRVVDPGLLERVEGNNFRTRVYPIPANGTRTIAIGYEEELTLEKERLQYKLPTAYPYPIETFSIIATVWNSTREPFIDIKNDLSFNKSGENYIASFVRKKYTPPRELSFALYAPTGIPQIAMQSAQGSYYFLASVTPNSDQRKRHWDDKLAIIWDVSLSGSQRDLTREMEMLNTIFAEKKETDVNLYFLNNKYTPKGNYKVTGGRWDKLRSALDSAVFDGGTDFSQINLNDIKGNEILFFSDGISTLSDSYFSIDTAETRPIHCVVSSVKADYGAMRLIADRTNGKFMNISALSPERLKSELLYETLFFLGTEHGEEVREVYPSIATPVYGNFSISGIADTNRAEITLLFGFDSTVETRVKVLLDAKSASSPIDAYKIWAQKKITELELDYYNNRDELTELAQRFGLVTRNTSLIVLESIDDYVRYGIAPPTSENELYAQYQRRTGGGGRIGVAGIGYGSSGYGSGFGGSGGGSGGGNRVSGTTRESSSREERVAKLVRSEAEPAATLERQKESSGGISSNKGGGDPRARVTQMGVLGVVSGQVKGKPVASADVFGKGGFSTDIDAILSDVGGLKSGGDGGVGRKGTAGLSYGSGYGSGFGGSGGSDREIDDLLGGLMGGSGDGLPLRKNTGEPKISSPNFLNGGALTGGRSRASIQRVVMQNMAALRYAYNKRLRDVPGLRGKVTIKFAIDEFGSVIFAQIVESTLFDRELENTVLSRVKSWNFERIDKPGDVTETVYPFVFSNDGASTTPQNNTNTTQNYWDPGALNGALVAANNLSFWWTRDFTLPPKSKYPTPDKFNKIAGASDIVSVTKDNGYLDSLTGKAAEDYKLYLKMRKNHANSPAFYFDMANWFYTLGDKETAIRVLTSIADLEIENASLYRLLGYRLKEYGEYALEKFVCGKVLIWRPMEPQSYRDYALALADNGETQAALDYLYALLAKTYTANIRERSRGIEEVVTTEINHLIVKDTTLNKSHIDKRLIIKIPVDIRVVINWNMNSVDINLHIKDPNNEECFRDRRETSTGGRLSADIRDGYGPEQFLLKKAIKGKYRVYVNYYGDIQLTDAGPATVMAEIYTKYTDATERRQVVCVQMSNAKKRDGDFVEVAEFDF